MQDILIAYIGKNISYGTIVVGTHTNILCLPLGGLFLHTSFAFRKIYISAPMNK